MGTVRAGMLMGTAKTIATKVTVIDPLTRYPTLAARKRPVLLSDSHLLQSLMQLFEKLYRLIRRPINERMNTSPHRIRFILLDLEDRQFVTLRDFIATLHRVDTRRRDAWRLAMAKQPMPMRQ